MRVIALALALAGRAAIADELSLPVDSVFGSKTACELYGFGGERAVLSGFSDPLPPEPWTEVTLIVPEGIFYIEGRCTPIEVSGTAALLKCGAEGAEWIESATLVVSADTVTFSAKAVSGDLDQLTGDTWGPDTYSKCAIGQKR